MSQQIYLVIHEDYDLDFSSREILGAFSNEGLARTYRAKARAYSKQPENYIIETLVLDAKIIDERAYSAHYTAELHESTFDESGILSGMDDLLGELPADVVRGNDNTGKLYIDCFRWTQAEAEDAVRAAFKRFHAERREQA